METKGRGVCSPGITLRCLESDYRGDVAMLMAASEC